MRRFLFLIGLLAATAGPAVSADYYAPAPAPAPPAYSHGALPGCDNANVVARIPERFAYYDARVIGSGLAITGVDGIEEFGIQPGYPGLIDRRYCGATAWLSNGTTSPVYYIIEGPKLAFASIAWHVESCLPGFDPYRVYDARCRAIRP